VAAHLGHDAGVVVVAVPVVAEQARGLGEDDDRAIELEPQRGLGEAPTRPARSLRLLLRKSREDLISLRRNEIGGWLALICKNARKLPQFMSTR
jgi:hypothetical protein